MESVTSPSSRSNISGLNRSLLNPDRAKMSRAWGLVAAVTSLPFLPTCYPTAVLWLMSTTRKLWPVTKVITIRASFFEPQWDVHSAYNKPSRATHGAAIVEPRKEVWSLVTMSALNVPYIWIALNSAPFPCGLYHLDQSTSRWWSLSLSAFLRTEWLQDCIGI